MSGAALPPRRGAHRARRSPLAALVPSLLAVGAVLALVGILYAVLGSPPARTSNAADGGPGGGPSGGPAVATTTPASTSPAPSGDVTTAASTSPASTTPASTTPASTTSASTEPSSPAPTGDRSPAAENPTTAPAPSTSPAAPAAPHVVVLNETRRSGLAAETAARLRARGWRVDRVGNFRGNVGETTVYYPRGGEQAARELAADLVGVDRVRPVFPGIAPDRLTVVLAPSYAG